MKWFRLHTEIKDDPASLDLTDKEFREAFIAAVDGKESPLSNFIQSCGPPGAEPEYRREWRSLSKILSPIIFLRDGYKCTYCHDTEFLSVDHIMPLSRGGSNGLENLTTACRSCNSRKSNKTLEEWSR